MSKPKSKSKPKTKPAKNGRRYLSGFIARQGTGELAKLKSGEKRLVRRPSWQEFAKKFHAALDAQNLDDGKASKLLRVSRSMVTKLRRAYSAPPVSLITGGKNQAGGTAPPMSVAFGLDPKEAEELEWLAWRCHGHEGLLAVVDAKITALNAMVVDLMRRPKTAR